MEILKGELTERFFDLVSSSKEKIRLCAPYVKTDVVKNINKNKKEKVKIEIISNFNLANFYRKSSDIGAFKEIIQSKGKVYNNQSLHAKIYIFDDNYSIITSANLTTSGFKRNVEYGVFIKEKNLVAETINDFNLICHSDNTGKISFKDINSIEEILNCLPPINDMGYFNINDELNTKLEVDFKKITKELSPWKSLTLEVINSIEQNEFSLTDIYKKEEIFKLTYPNNNTIRDSIRRNLQELRDLGLIRFLGNGKYEKIIGIK